MLSSHACMGRGSGKRPCPCCEVGVYALLHNFGGGAWGEQNLVLWDEDSTQAHISYMQHA